MRDRAKDLAWRRANAVRLRGVSKKWYAKNRKRRLAQMVAYSKQKYAENPAPFRARMMLRYGVLTGKVKKLKRCQHCRRVPKRIEAHHHKGYAKEFWYVVTWLCTPCHRAADRQDHTNK